MAKQEMSTCGHLTLLKQSFVALKGKMYKDWLVTGPYTRYKVRNGNNYNLKSGYFLIRNHLVLRYIPG